MLLRAKTEGGYNKDFARVLGVPTNKVKHCHLPAPAELFPHHHHILSLPLLNRPTTASKKGYKINPNLTMLSTRVLKM